MKKREKHRVLGRLLFGPKTRAKIDTAEDFRDFFARQTAFISQKSTYEYCRARTGLHWNKLLREEAFLAALERCRWEAYAAVAQDLGLLFEGRLRPHFAQALPTLALFMVGSLSATLNRFKPPPWRTQGWEPEISGFALRLEKAQLARPLPANEIGRVAGNRIFDTLPVHPRLRTEDREMLQNSLRFAMVRCNEDANERLDLSAIADSVLVASVAAIAKQ